MNLDILLSILFLVILLWETTLFILKKRNLGFFAPILIFIIVALFRFTLLSLGEDSLSMNIVVYLIYFISFSMILINLIKLVNPNAYKFKQKSGFYIKKSSIIIFNLGLIAIVGYLINVNFVQTDNEYAKELTIYDWGDYFAPGVLEGFETEFGIKINYEVFDDEFEMYEELKKGEKIYDFVFVSDALLPKLIEEDLVQSINVKNIPNINNLGDKFYQGQRELFGVPYTWGSTGIVVNTKYVSENVDSWSIFWNQKYSGRVSILDNPDEVIVMNNLFISGKLLPRTASDIAKIKEFFNLQKNIVIPMSDLQSTEEMINENIWISHNYNGEAATIIEQVPTAKYVLPKEGFLGWIDYMAIPSISKNSVTTELFIDYILRPEVSAMIVNYQYYASANQKATQYVDEDILNDPLVYIHENEFSKLDFISDYALSSEYQELRNYLFVRLKHE